jgi:hypothetical protein
MTLKMKIVGALLATGLIAGAGQAKADVVRVRVGPARAGYVQPAPRSGRGWDRSYYRRVVRAPTAVPVRVPVAVPVSVPVQNGGYGNGYDGSYGYAAPGAQDPSVVAFQIRAEMNRAAEDVRFDVGQGVVERRALAALEADRQEIERDLAEASAKGYITADDRAHLEQHVQELRDLRDQLRCANGGGVAYAR